MMWAVRARTASWIRRRGGGRFIAACALVALVATACGGGGGGNNATGSTRPKGTTTTGPTTTTTAPPVNYQVQRGDTLTSIANKFHVSVATILASNQIANPDRLNLGQMLVIPAPPPVSLTVTPPSGLGGTSFAFKVLGAKPGESVTFEIDYPGGKFTGRPHIATNTGEVDATYVPSTGAAPGTYNVTGVGTQGTLVKSSFQLIGAQLPPTSAPG